MKTQKYTNYDLEEEQEELHLTEDQKMQLKTSEEKTIHQLAIELQEVLIPTIHSPYKQGTYSIDPTSNIIYYTVRKNDSFSSILVNNFLTADKLINYNDWDNIEGGEDFSRIIKNNFKRSLQEGELIALGRIDDFLILPKWVRLHISTANDLVYFDQLVLEYKSKQLNLGEGPVINDSTYELNSKLDIQNYFKSDLFFKEEEKEEWSKKGFPITPKIELILSKLDLNSADINGIFYSLSANEQNSFLYHTIFVKEKSYEKGVNQIEKKLYVESLSGWESENREVFLRYFTLKNNEEVNTDLYTAPLYEYNYDLTDKSSFIEEMETYIRKSIIGIRDYKNSKTENDGTTAINLKLTFKIGAVKLGFYIEGKIGGGVSLKTAVDKSLQVAAVLVMSVEGGIDLAQINTGINFELELSFIREFESVQHFVVHLMHKINTIEYFKEAESLQLYLSKEEHQKELQKRYIEYQKAAGSIKWFTKFGKNKPGDDGKVKPGPRNLVGISAKYKQGLDVTTYEVSEDEKKEKSKDFTKKDTSKSYEVELEFFLMGVFFKVTFSHSSNAANGDNNGSYLKMHLNFEKEKIEEYPHIFSMLSTIIIELGKVAISNKEVGQAASFDKNVAQFEAYGYSIFDLIYGSFAGKTDIKVTKVLPNFAKKYFYRNKKIDSKTIGVTSATGLEVLFLNKGGRLIPQVLTKTSSKEFKISLEVDRKLADLTGGYYGGAEFSFSTTSAEDIYFFEDSLGYLSTQVNGLMYESDSVEEREKRHRMFIQVQNLRLVGKEAEAQKMIEEYWLKYHENRSFNKEQNVELDQFYEKHQTVLQEVGTYFLQSISNMIEYGQKMGYDKDKDQINDFKWKKVQHLNINGITPDFMQKYVDPVGPLLLLSKDEMLRTSIGQLAIKFFNDRKKIEDIDFIKKNIFPFLFEKREEYNFNIFHYIEN